MFFKQWMVVVYIHIYLHIYIYIGISHVTYTVYMSYLHGCNIYNRSYRFSSQLCLPRSAPLKMKLPKIVCPGSWRFRCFFWGGNGLEFLFWRNVSLPLKKQKQQNGGTTFSRGTFLPRNASCLCFFVCVWEVVGGSFLESVFFSTPRQKYFQNSLRMCKFFEMNRGN